MAKKESWLRVIRLVKPYSFDISALAGLESSIGDKVVVLRQDNDPPASIVTVLEHLRDGVEVVQGTVNQDRGGVVFRFCSRGFCAVGRLLGLQFYPSSSLFGFTRLAAQALTRERQRFPHLGLLAAGIGYRRRQFAYQPLSQTPNYGFFQAVDRGITLLSANSISPLRFISWLGMGAGFANLAYVLYVCVVHCVKQKVVEGWTTLSLQISSMFFLVFCILVLMSEYIRHIHEASKEQPLYHVSEEVGSSPLISLDATRNVLGHSAAAQGTNANEPPFSAAS